MGKTYSVALIERVEALKEGLEPQVLAQLWAVDTGLREKRVASKCRRILSKKVYPGDLPEVERLEAAKADLLTIRH